MVAGSFSDWHQQHCTCMAHGMGPPRGANVGLWTILSSTALFSHPFATPPSVDSPTLLRSCIPHRTLRAS
jgi:hypothetical protein